MSLDQHTSTAALKTGTQRKARVIRVLEPNVFGVMALLLLAPTKCMRDSWPIASAGTSCVSVLLQGDLDIICRVVSVPIELVLQYADPRRQVSGFSPLHQRMKGALKKAPKKRSSNNSNVSWLA